MKAKAKPKRKPRRVVLGVGHPWYWTEGPGVRLGLLKTLGEGRLVKLRIFDLGEHPWARRIRLVAEVLK